jgi:hypothetical protein
MSAVASGVPIWERLSLRGWILLAGAVALAWAGWASARASRQAPKTAHEEKAPVLPTRLEPEELTEAEADREAAPVAGYRRDIVRPRPVQNTAEPDAPKDDTPPPSAPGGPASPRRDEKNTHPEIFSMPGESPV